MDYLKSWSTSISNASIVTQKPYGGLVLLTKIENQPKLLEYLNDEETALKSLLAVDALLNEKALEL